MGESQGAGEKIVEDLLNKEKNSLFFKIAKRMWFIEKQKLLWSERSLGLLLSGSKGNIHQGEPWGHLNQRMLERCLI